MFLCTDLYTEPLWSPAFVQFESSVFCLEAMVGKANLSNFDAGRYRGARRVRTVGVVIVRCRLAVGHVVMCTFLQN